MRWAFSARISCIFLDVKAPDVYYVDDVMATFKFIYSRRCRQAVVYQCVVYLLTYMCVCMCFSVTCGGAHFKCFTSILTPVPAFIDPPHICTVWRLLFNCRHSKCTSRSCLWLHCPIQFTRNAKLFHNRQKYDSPASTMLVRLLDKPASKVYDPQTSPLFSCHFHTLPHSSELKPSLWCTPKLKCNCLLITCILLHDNTNFKLFTFVPLQSPGHKYVARCNALHEMRWRLRAHRKDCQFQRRALAYAVFCVSAHSVHLI